MNNWKTILVKEDDKNRGGSYLIKPVKIIFVSPVKKDQMYLQFNSMEYTENVLSGSLKKCITTTVDTNFSGLV